MHHALREVLGDHVEQKGSLVDPDYLRFDFSHYQKVTDQELREVEQMVNRMIRMNSPREEHRSVPMSTAEEMGAIALFGEKYGDTVRVIKFGETVELCGGTHVEATGQIGFFKILRESSIAAGIRRIEAITGETAEKYINDHVDMVRQIAGSFEKQKDLVKAVKGMIDQNSKLSKQVERFQRNVLAVIGKTLEQKMEKVGDVIMIVSRVDLDDASQLRDLAFQMRSRHKRLSLCLGAEIGGKAHLAIMLSDELLANYDLNASKIVREISPEIQGGGGGQPFFATAGGKNPKGIDAALDKARKIINEAVG
jgi:alanyl-tRNA synthetase